LLGSRCPITHWSTPPRPIRRCGINPIIDTRRLCKRMHHGCPPEQQKCNRQKYRSQLRNLDRAAGTIDRPKSVAHPHRARRLSYSANLPLSAPVVARRKKRTIQLCRSQWPAVSLSVLQSPPNIEHRTSNLERVKRIIENRQAGVARKSAALIARQSS
jgi:hypothetical protein